MFIFLTTYSAFQLNLDPGEYTYSVYQNGKIEWKKDCFCHLKRVEYTSTIYLLSDNNKGVLDLVNNFYDGILFACLKKLIKLTKFEEK